MGVAHPTANKDDQPLPPLPPVPDSSDSVSILTSNLIPNQSFYTLSSSTPTEVISSLVLEAHNPPSSSRVSVDLVLVIDVSGSMAGEKLSLVKKTLNFLLTQLTATDRVSLVTFSTSASRICKLTCCDQAGKTRLEKMINNLKDLDSTNLVAGLEYGLCVLAGRRVINQSSALILLTDGIDDNRYDSIDRARAVIEKVQIGKEYSIHTFGYGSDHDASLLNSISDLKSGGFYYIEKFESIAEAFANCLGEVMSVLFDNIQVSLETLGCEVPFALTKVFSETGDNVFKLPGLLRGVKKEVVFCIELKPAEIEIDEVEVRIVKGIVRYRDVKKDVQEAQECFLDIKIKKASEEKPTVNEECMVNYYRFKAAETIKVAGELGDHNQLEDARHQIDICLESMKKSDLSEHKLTAVLMNDLEKAKSNFRDYSHYSGQGKLQNMKCAKSHWNKRGEEIDLYQNECQMDMILESKNYFSKH